ncbi:MAG: preprotein translocase subunit SecG [Actinomycetaceae bacterium]|nr:preprotein translocase subunit SecG [Actinomycetaceae bacterium]
MSVLMIVLKVLLVLTSIFLVLTILMHKGKGGGLSDMFGGGLSSSASSSGVAERNLQRITIGTLVLWTVVIVAIGILQKFI